MQPSAILVIFGSAKLGLGTDTEREREGELELERERVRERERGREGGREREAPQMPQGIFAKYKDSEALALVIWKKHIVFDYSPYFALSLLSLFMRDWYLKMVAFSCTSQYAAMVLLPVPADHHPSHSFTLSESGSHVV